MVIRTAEPGDAHAIAALAGELGYPTTPRRALARLARLPADGSRTVLVAESDGRVVAWMELARRTLLVAEDYAEITGLVVASSERSRGIGRELLEHARAWARTRGLARLRVRTNETRAATHAFYQRHGFTLSKSQRVYDLADP